MYILYAHVHVCVQRKEVADLLKRVLSSLNPKLANRDFHLASVRCCFGIREGGREGGRGRERESIGEHESGQQGQGRVRFRVRVASGSESGSGSG